MARQLNRPTCPGKSFITSSLSQFVREPVIAPACLAPQHCRPHTAPVSSGFQRTGNGTFSSADRRRSGRPVLLAISLALFSSVAVAQQSDAV
jgi:hypothetical protein